jgi:hypothetical protein
VPTSTSSDFDGDGQKIREVNNGSSPTYYLRSSVLPGAIIEELDGSGQKQFGYVYTPSGSLIARQISFTNAVALKQMSPNGATEYEFLKGEAIAPSVIRHELDPMGADIKLNPWPVRPNGGPGNIPSAGGASDGRFGAIENPAAGCMQLLDGIPTPCDMFYRMVGSGAVELRVGDRTYDLQVFGDSHIWVDAWEDYFTPGKGFRGNDELGDGEWDAGTSGTRNVGYFITIPGGGGPLASSLAMRPMPQNPTNKGTPMTDAEITKHRAAVDELLQDKTCRSFVKGVLAQIGDAQRKAFNGDVLKIFDKVTSLKGWGWRNAAEMNYDNGEAGSYVGNTSQTAYINISRGAPRIYGDSSSVGFVGRLVIHELLHVGSSAAGNFSHWDMFKAAYPVAQRLGLRLGTRTPTEKNPGGRDDYNSSGFDDLLFEACQIRKVRGAR